MKNFILYLCFSILLFSCNSNTDSKSGDKNLTTYQKTKETLASKEKKNPLAFLTVSGKKKKNLIGQTVIRGRIINNASVASYKDVDVQLSFYSKTGTLLEKDNEVVYEIITPGTSKSFKTKYFAPKGTDSVAYEIVAAKVN